MNEQVRLLLQERELQRLIAQSAGAPLTRAILTLDLVVRRAVRRLLGPSAPRARYSTRP